MKHPNGYGTVVKLSGRRRRPWAVRKTLGFDERHYPIYVNIGYAETKEKGLIMLAEYNKNPWNPENEKMTLKDLYRLWLDKRCSKLGESNARCLKSAWNYCKHLADRKYREIRAIEMQDCIDSCRRGYSTQANIKNLWRHLDRFAQELDVIQKANSSFLNSERIPDSSRNPFTEEEIHRIWENENKEGVDLILFLLYTGFRFSECRTIRLKNVDLEEGIIHGGMKTEAGRNRIVPIHPDLVPIVRKRYEASQSGFLFENDGRPFSDYQLRKLWAIAVKELHMEHIPHECRHTFRSRMDSAGANKVCIDRIMGHKSEGVGERIYTHKTIQELKKAVRMLPGRPGKGGDDLSC